MTTALRRLAAADAAAYRALMLEAYATAPDAFTSSVAEREPLPPAWWEARLGNDAVFGAFDGGALVGAAGWSRQDCVRRERTAHKSQLFGMFVRAAARGAGHGRGLVGAVIDHAGGTPGVELIQLTVSAGNANARRLYERCGFNVYGTEPMALRIGDRHVDKVLMWRRLP